MSDTSELIAVGAATSEHFSGWDALVMIAFLAFLAFAIWCWTRD